MRRSNVRRLLCAVGAAAVLTGGALALESGDGFITLNYLANTFFPSAKSQLEAVQNQAMEEAYAQAAAGIAPGGAGEPDGLSSADFRSRTFAQGDLLTLTTGSGFLMYEGKGELAHDGVVIDVTDGTEVPTGSFLAAGHRYLVGEDTSAAVAVRSGVLYLGLEGHYSHTDAGTGAPPFVDVAEGDWYADAVAYAYTNGLFSGTSEDTFSPELPMNRAMVMTVFYRLAGSPAEELNRAEAEFADVAADSWYAPYVRWGAVQQITAGVGGNRFAPEENVTRQQLLVMLHSFARQYLGLPLSGAASLSGYADGAQVAAWAQEAMSWAVANQLISPAAGGALRPDDPASRAEVAAILMQFHTRCLEPFSSQNIE